MFCAHRFIGWIETSAKEDVNVEKAMVYLIKHILALDDDNYEPPSQKSVSLSEELLGVSVPSN